MKLNVLFFGATAALVGSRNVETAVADSASPSDVLEHLIATYPNLKDRDLLFAVNEQYVTSDTVLNDGDELAIFTHVSGG